MNTYQVTDADKFFDALMEAKDNVRVVRTYASQMVEYAEGKWQDAPFIRCFYSVGVETVEGPAKFTFTEYIPIEVPSGILRTGGTLWRRIKDANLPLFVDMSRSGAL